MQHQGNQISQNYPQNQQNITPIYNQQGDEQYNSNQGAPIQYYEKPHSQDYPYSNNFQVPIQNQNNYNTISSPKVPINQLDIQTIEPQVGINQPLMSNDYLLAQENENLNNYINNNTLTIYYQNLLKNILYGFIFITSIIIIIFAPSFHIIYTIIILLIENIIHLYFLSYKIELTKDIIQNRIIVKKINYLCRIKESFDIPLDSFYFDIRQYGTIYTLIIINNFKNGENTRNIRNSPAKIIYYFNRININKFNGSSEELHNIIDYFIRIPNKSPENPLNFNINTYIHKIQYFQPNLFDFNKYIKFNEHFFSYFNGNPLVNNRFHLKIFQGLSCLIHFIVALSVSLTIGLYDEDSNKNEDPEKEKEANYLIIFVSIVLFCYPGIYLILYIICKFVKCCAKSSIRIDIIYSRDFDKLFIGIVNVNKNSYLSTKDFNIREIDKFVLSKNKPEENGFHLIPIYKGDNNINTTGKEIFFIKDSQVNLEGLVYILNEKLIPNNNNNNFNTGCPTPTNY